MNTLIISSFDVQVPSVHPWFKHSYTLEIYVYQTPLLVVVLLLLFSFFSTLEMMDPLQIGSFSFLVFPCCCDELQMKKAVITLSSVSTLLLPRDARRVQRQSSPCLPFTYPEQSTHMQRHGLFSFPIIRERRRGKIKEVLKSFDI